MGEELVLLGEARKNLCLACMKAKSSKMSALNRVLELCSIPHQSPARVSKHVAELVLSEVGDDPSCKLDYVPLRALPEGVIVPGRFIQELHSLSLAGVKLVENGEFVACIAKAMNVTRPSGKVHEAFDISVGWRDVVVLSCHANGRPSFTSDPKLVTCEQCRAASTVRALL